MRTIAFMNQKGGVGKTTCTANLAAALAERGRRILLVDMDPQANLTVHLDQDARSVERSIYDVLSGDARIEDAVRESRAGIALVPSHINLSGAELELATAVGRELLLRDALTPFLEAHPCDYVLIDCPPSLGLLSLNALVAAREVFIPVQAEFLALQGMAKLLDVVELVRRRVNPGLRVSGIITVLYDGRTGLAREVDQEIRRHFGALAFATRIRKNVRLAEAPSHGRTILEHAPASAGAQDFRTLAGEVEERAGPAGP
ncbi:MAG: ParA family protein [Planctomycetes bacterium]|nr:ParA family protein [Planctomycetota bacterium]